MSRKNKPDPNHPFAALGKLKEPDPTPVGKSAPAPAPKRSDVEVWRPSEAENFAAAMHGVVPLSQKPTRVTTHGVPPSATATARTVPLATKLKRVAAEGGDALRVTWDPDGGVRGCRRGREFALEALERFAVPEERCDLHGLDAAEARIRAREFVRSRRARGRRCVALICGRGKRSPDGASVLLDAVVQELTACGADVEAFRTAPEDQGGHGAVLAALG